MILAGVLVPTHTAYAWPFDGMVKDLFGGIAQLLMSLASLALIFSGAIFDWMIQFTVVDLAKNIGGSEGVGKSITTAWATLRDVANMAFIFVLLYAAFNAMFRAEFGGLDKTIRNIIIVALLINFSLFFSKVVIDASNIVAVGFYNSISTNSYPLGGNTNVAFGGGLKGIAGGYAKMLGIQTLYSANILDKNLEPGQLLVVGIMSATFMLIVAVILLIVGIMFAARFIILIFLMILSPLALIAYIIPGLKSRFEEWKKALIDQSFFAPLYFALTWVVFKLGTSFREALDQMPTGKVQSTDFTNMFNDPQSSVALLVNYVLIIGFSVAALILSKKMASSTFGFKQISGGIGAGVIGGAALAGRQTVGRVASRLSESKWLNDRAGRSALAMGALQASRKVGSGSFDVRGVASTKLGKAVQADKLLDSDIVGNVSEKAKGGFNASLQRGVEKKEKTAQSLKTDQARRDYAARQVSGLGRLYARGGSRPLNKRSLFGTMGRSNRIVAAKILGTQLTNLNNQLQTLQSRDNQLSQQLSNMNNEQTTLNNNLARNPQQNARLAQLNGGVGVNGSIANIQNQLANVQTHLTNVNNLINDPVNGVQTQINALGITNPANQIVNPVTGTSRAARADEQNY